MAAVDPYAPCPCGSGEKFKWCCHKVEAHAEKAIRLRDSGQFDAALQALDEGLRKSPANPWLSNQKALILLQNERAAEAVPVLEAAVAKHPRHAAAIGMLIRATLEAEGPVAGAERLQQALPDLREGDPRIAAATAQLVGILMRELGMIAGAIAHLKLGLLLQGPETVDPSLNETLRTLESHGGYSPWLRNPYRLTATPPGLDEPTSERFDQAVAWASEGLWSAAGAAFELLSADNIPEADRNLGLCWLWMAKHAEATVALRRYIARAGNTMDAVDLEGLCQHIAPVENEELLDEVQLIWTLRDRDGLLARLRAAENIADEGTLDADPDDPESFEVEGFELLDRPALKSVPETSDELPIVLGRVLVGHEIVMLQAIDDGRLESLTNRLRDLAGPAIPPAHPRTKELGKVSRDSVKMRADWWIPEKLDSQTTEKFAAEHRVRIINDIWPDLPLPALHGRTPRQAAASGQDPVALRAAALLLEENIGPDPRSKGAIDFRAFRERLGIPLEPEIDPATADIEGLHITRLQDVPASKLDDDRLVELYQRSGQSGVYFAQENAAMAILDRPEVMKRPEIGVYPLYEFLAECALARGETQASADWFDRGRQTDPESRGTNAVHWDLLSIRLRSQYISPEEWVPDLAVALDRYTRDPQTRSALLLFLARLGLIQLVSSLEDPGKVAIDSSLLEKLIAHYGPRISTASGGLGVSATRGGIWTPGSEAGSSPAGLWTPGSAAAPGPAGQGDKPRIILPGQ